MTEVAGLLAVHDHIVKLTTSERYKAVEIRIKDGIGDCYVGVIMCIDGRIPDILFSGISRWETPGGLISTYNLVTDELLIPRSARLSNRLNAKAQSGRDLVELVLGHYDSHLYQEKDDHGCAAFKKRIGEGLARDFGLALPHAHVVDLQRTTATAVDNQYRLVRPLQRVSLTLLFDTATSGLDLDWTPELNKGLSTAKLCTQFKSTIDALCAPLVGVTTLFGYYGAKDTDASLARLQDVNNFLGLSEDLVDLTDILLGRDSRGTGHTEISQAIVSYFTKNHPELTQNQVNALVYVFARTIAFQYLSGFSEAKPDTNHGYREHDERAASITLDDRAVLDLDPRQSFVSNAADPLTAQEHIALKLALIQGRRRLQGRSFTPLFVSSSISREDFNQRDGMYGVINDKHLELLRQTMGNENLRGYNTSGSMVMVPVLLEQGTGGILQISDVRKLL